MWRLWRFIQRNWLIVPLLLIFIVTVAVFTYLTGYLGISRDPVRTVDVEQVTAVPPLPGTPIARFFQLDPAIINYLDNQPNYAPAPLDALGPDIQSIGAYLPRTGNTQFDFTQPTPLPTPLPYPTSPPLPLPYVPEEILPTVSPLTENGTPRTLPYELPEGAECAPEGNPVDGVLTQRFHLYHPGIDIGVNLGTPVLATHSAQVIFADWSDIGYGYLVILQSGSFITYYAHNTSFNVTVGQFVGKGSIIAWSGSTGNSTGPHVHYETRVNDIPVDPLTFDSRGFAPC